MFKSFKKTDEELQAELKSLVQTIVAFRSYNIVDKERYEALLKEIYIRNLKPSVFLERNLHDTKTA
jgi:hypothetical protein